MMKHKGNVYVLTVYPEHEKHDVYFLLELFGDSLVTELKWWVGYLDCVGHDAQEFCERIFQKRGLIIEGQELYAQAKYFDQVIEGIFVGFYGEVSQPEDILANFPSEPCPIAIKVIDGMYFDVYTKDDGFVARLKSSFKKVVENDIGKFFMNK